MLILVLFNYEIKTFLNKSTNGEQARSQTNNLLINNLKEAICIPVIYLFLYLQDKILYITWFPNWFVLFRSCRSPLVLPTRKWSVRVLMTKAVWATMPSPGACTGLEPASPSGTTTRRNCWAHPKPRGLASIWTSTQGF